MLKNFRYLPFIFVFSEIILMNANQLPTLTSLSAEVVARSVKAQLNGHNWHPIQTQLKTLVPREVYESIIGKINTRCRYIIKPVPFRKLSQSEGVSALSMPVESGLIAESCSDTVCLWDIQHGRLLQILDHPTTRRSSIYLSPDKKIVVFTQEQGNIFVSNLPNRRQIGVLSGHTQAINTIVISADNKLLISGSVDQTIRTWDIEHGILLHICRGHTGSVNSIALSGDKEYIVSGSDDQTIKTWLVATGELISTVKGHDNAVSSIALSPQGHLITSGSRDGTICIWQIATYQDPLEYLSRLVASKKGFLEQLKFVIHKYPHSALATLGIISSLLSYYIVTLR